MIQESAAEYKINKPVICPKCEYGKLGFVPDWSEMIVSRRGKPPHDEQDEGLLIKCPVCKKLWVLTIK